MTKESKTGTLTFEPIAAVGTIGSYTRSDSGKGLKVAFKELHYSDGHRDLLDRLMDDKIQVRVTIELVDPTAFEVG